MKQGVGVYSLLIYTITAFEKRKKNNNVGVGRYMVQWFSDLDIPLKDYKRLPCKSKCVGKQSFLTFIM